MIQTTACFTGYRDSKMPFSSAENDRIDALKSELCKMIRHISVDVDTYVCGMCHGADMWAADAVLSLRAELKHRLICVIPFDGHREHIPRRYLHDYDRILNEADEIHIVCQSVSEIGIKKAFNERNRYMLNISGRVIAICPYTDVISGGTKNTVSMARTLSKTIHFIDPLTLAQYTEVNRP